jgi:diketogulonate reductase-like aldo/keto reductase
MEHFDRESVITLNNGIRMPRIGLGVWQAADGEEVRRAILWALEDGYRLIDTAKIYGNEKGVGAAIAAAPCAREEIFLTTKLWNENQGYEPALRAIDASLSRLGASYVDLYLVHWPSRDRTTREATWKAMEDILASGKAKAIGVSNYPVELLEETREYAAIMPAVDQVEFHPFLFQKELLAYCTEHGIALEAYSPLARGRKLDDARISAIAASYGKSNAQVLIRWSLQHGCITIPKSVRKERIAENIAVFDFELSGEDMDALDRLNGEDSMLGF